MQKPTKYGMYVQVYVPGIVSAIHSINQIPDQKTKLISPVLTKLLLATQASKDQIRWQMTS